MATCSGFRATGRAVVAVSAVLATLVLPSRAPAQVSSFPSSATVSYELGAQLFQTTDPGRVLNDAGQLSTSNPLTHPVQLIGNLSGAVGVNGAAATASATLIANAGLLRAGVTGSTSASWQVGEGSEGRVNASARVGWTDYVLVSGNPAAPPLFRPLIVQAFLNVGGTMTVNPTPAATFPAFSGAGGNVKLKLSGLDALNRNLLAPPPFAYAFTYGQEIQTSGSATNGVIPTLHQPPIAVVPVTLMLVENQPAFMSYTMEVVGMGNAKNDSPLFAGMTSVSFIGDFTHTLTWGGITSVTDATTGAAVSGWSIASASGADYANPIPEPASAATLLALAAPALLVRRRSHGQRATRN